MLEELPRDNKIEKIKRITVTKLFGTFDHTIPLNEDSRTTILVGASGFGKTVILKLLKDLFSRSNKTLRTIPFEELRVDFEDERDDQDVTCDFEEQDFSQEKA